MRPKTSHRTPEQHVREWHLVDAEGQVLGRMARDVAIVLMGKHRPTWSPHYDSGDGVIVVNCTKVRLTGRKPATKVYRRYTGYPGGHREEPFARRLAEHPERIVTEAVRRMLPKNTLGRKMLRKLKVYPGPEHPHAAQKPTPLAVG